MKTTTQNFQLMAPCKVLDRYTDRNVYPLGVERPDGAFGIVAEVNGCGGTVETNRAYADLFCRAVNSHDALLAALAEVCEQHDALLAAYGKPFGWGRLITDNARAAIAAGKVVAS